MQSLPFSAPLAASPAGAGFDFSTAAPCGDSAQNSADTATNGFAALLNAQQADAASADATEENSDSPATELTPGSATDRSTSESLLALMLPFAPPPATTPPVTVALTSDPGQPQADAAAATGTEDGTSAAFDDSLGAHSSPAAPCDAEDGSGISPARALSASAFPPAARADVATGPKEDVSADLTVTARATVEFTEEPAAPDTSAATVSPPDAAPAAPESSPPQLPSTPASPLSLYATLAMTRAANDPREPAAKISRAGDLADVTPETTDSPREINFLNTFSKELTDAPTEVGTAVAKSPAESMSPRTATHSAQPGLETSVESLVAAAASLLDASTSTVLSTSTPEAATATPRAAVQQVIATVEAAQTAQESAPKQVKLDFDFGDAQVQVRIEIRHDLVRAHFQTDSAEVRNSLNQEWRVAAAAEPARFARVAEPVFTSDQNSFSNSENAPRDHGQRESAAQQQATREHAPLFSRFLGRSPAMTTPTAIAAEARAPLVTLTQLNAFA